MRRVGDILLSRGLVSRRDVDEALAVQRQMGGFLGSALVRLGAVSEEALLAALSDELGVPVLDRSALPSADVVRAGIERVRAPMSWLVEKEVVPWFVNDKGTERLCVASRHVYDSAIQEAAEQWHHLPALLYLASSQALSPLLVELGAQADGAQGGADPSRLRELAEEAPVIDFVNAMLGEALTRRASDVHVEPFEDRLVVRFRIDGALTAWRTAPRSMFDAVASRIKLLSGMDIAERRLPQDGRQSIRVSGRDVDMRVSSLPTTWGESIVMRFLGKTMTLPEFSQLGLAQDQGDLLMRMIEKPNGVLLITGPTGSGKTTTVYRLLMHLNDGVRKIVTVEDPVEIDLPGVLQVQVRADIGLSFAAGLRSILRQDPDVILIGEIRDPETAKIAVQAALTGQLVISTVHTNSALGAVARLLDLGVEEYLLADVVRGLIGQRLVRRVCESCAKPVTSGAEEEHARLHYPQALSMGAASWREGAGCARCNRMGFQGRIGVYEAVEIDDQLQTLIRHRASEAEMEAQARAKGFRSLSEDGLLKARAGLTTLREALRVVGV